MNAILLFLIIFMTGCSNKTTSNEPDEKVDNPVTRYADGLHQGVNKAEDAAAKANEKIMEMDKRASEIE
jgi:uncharacterized protein YceK